MIKYLVKDGKHLPYTDENGKPDHHLMGAAWAALHGGYRGNKYEGADKDKAIAELDRIYEEEGMEPPGKEETGESEPAVAKAREGAVLCRATVELPQTPDSEIMYLPGGEHSITPFGGGVGKPIRVLIDASAMAALERERSAISARKVPYFDFNHEDGPASFWPHKFFWRDGPSPGVYAKGEWSARGRESVQGKEYRYFSPVFYVDSKQAAPARVVCRETAHPNMGGLTNDPAFHNILPLWAKSGAEEALDAASRSDAGASGEEPPNKEQEITMTAEELAALRAKEQELETKVEKKLSDPVSKSGEGENNQDNDLQSDLRVVQAEIKAAEAQKKMEEQGEQLRKRQHADAKTAVKRAVLRGAVAARDVATQDDLINRATVDPNFIQVIDRMQGKGALDNDRLTSRNTVNYPRITNEDPMRVYGELAKVLSISARGPRDEKVRCAREFAAIYSKEFSGDNNGRLLGFPVSELESAIRAADVTDSNLGTLAGTLVTQRTLELLKFTFPALTAFTTDFSDQPVTFNQVLMTRIITIPTASDYNTTTGWADSAAVTTDVPVTINKHKGVPITFNEQTLASTVRRLFDEFAPASAYALAKAMVDDLYANITDANFTHSVVIATSAFSRAGVVSMGTDLTLRGVPLGLGQRTLLLYPTPFQNLVTDTALITFAAFQKPELITNPQQGSSLVIPIDTFQVINAPNLPTNNGNITGFGGSKSALVINTRTPNDYTSVLPGASFGNVQMVTDPDIGITVMLVQYVNHTLGTATSRIALMYGTAAGQGAAGTLLKAASGSGSSRA